MGKKSQYKKLQDKLFYKRNSAWENDKEKIFELGEKYKDFLLNSKTERSAAKTILQELKKAGFKDIYAISKLKTGDKVYLNCKDKSVVCAIIGEQVNNKFKLVGSHIDSPRLDLKPNPMYEDKGLALLKTHYYGGVKKYQWTNVDLALYGVIHTKEGKKIEFSLGEKEDEPRFIVSDLLPHLAMKQMEKTGNDIVEAEQLNIFIGNIPVSDNELKDKVKLSVLKHLNDKYGIVEEDFSFAELCFVPAGRPADIGFDRSMVAGYGQDDKACSFANMMAILSSKKPNVTAVSYFSDKEEIGSFGNTGAQSYILLEFAELLVAKLSLNVSPNQVLRDSKAISADVSTVFHPSFPDVHEERNSAFAGNGVIIEKYTGRGGKYSANDTHAEYMSEIRELLIKNKIKWQAAELGKVDIGGGGTIAMYLSRFGMDTVDAGPGVLGMHSPREVISKADLYEAFRLYKCFFES